MPWKEMSDMSQRREFVELAQAEGTNKRGLCRRFGISPTTGYKWFGRFREGSEAGLVELPRRPHYSPARTPSQVEQAVLSARAAHPAWGARKLRRWLLDRRDVFEADMPAPRTITAILRRHGRIDPAEGPKHRSWQRFEHQAPNDLWQMDFKGPFPLPPSPFPLPPLPLARGRCHPLTVLDDHSRFALGLQACGNEQGEMVQQRLTAIFRRYGLPNTMLMDNGSPWGHDQDHPYTPFTVWLLRLGIGVSHGGPYHPQTQGKDERFHRTMTVEVLQGSSFTDLAHCQRAFDLWRDIYNLERPHDALDLATPATKYQVSQRLFPEVLPPLEYEPTDLVRRVHDKGRLQLVGRIFKVPKAFKGMPVAIRPTTDDGVWNVFFATHQIAQLDLRHDAEHTQMCPPCVRSIHSLRRGVSNSDSRPFGVRPDEIPAVALETEPGDVLVFTERIIHGAFGGGVGRHQICANFVGELNTDEHVDFVRQFYERANWSVRPTRTYVDSDRPRIRRMVETPLKLGFEILEV